MLSFRDCAALSGLTDHEIAMVAERRHLPVTVAIACAVQEASQLRRLALEDVPQPRSVDAAPALIVEVVARPDTAMPAPAPIASSPRSGAPERVLGPSGMLALA